MMGPCYCMGPRPGHKLCPCRERLELERQRVRRTGLPTDQDRRNYVIGKVSFGRTGSSGMQTPIVRTKTITLGWQCPKCHAVYSPRVTECRRCKEATAG